MIYGGAIVEFMQKILLVLSMRYQRGTMWLILASFNNANATVGLRIEPCSCGLSTEQ
jgi:hypothetical protein